MANVTLKHGIEAMIQEAFPEIKRVIDTTNHDAETILTIPKIKILTPCVI